MLPTRAQVTPRPRLLARLADGAQRKLTLISAPAGFGKTTLVTSWLNQKGSGGSTEDGSSQALLQLSSPSLHPCKVAWLSLDDSDDNPARFWTYVINALQTVQPELGRRTLDFLAEPQPPNLDTALTFLLNDMATCPASLILVLDDYHVINDDAIHNSLAFLLDHLPPQLRLVIISRIDPPLPLPRLRARNQLNEFRVDDLRFTAAEAASFLNQTMGLSLSPQDVAALDARTEGWVAGLQLAAVSMQGRSDVSDFIATFTGSH
ncbi:MAG: hypothetical protein Kow0031_33510 [Anaerolineae bacterium]